MFIDDLALESEGLHPYQIKDPYGTDVVDLLRAANHFSNENNNFQINSQVFLAGYSEGGYAASNHRTRL